MSVRAGPRPPSRDRSEHPWTAAPARPAAFPKPGAFARSSTSGSPCPMACGSPPGSGCPPARDPGRPLLEYIPYRKRDLVRARDARNHPVFAANGYVCLRVDMRGSGDSEGAMPDMYAEAELSDARHVIDWIAAQAWSNGRVGMFGTSWGGTASLQAAVDAPGPLKAVLANCATIDRFEDDIHWMGGAVLTDTVEWGAALPAILACPPDSATVGDGWRGMWEARLAGLAFPLENWIAHGTRGRYWRHGSVRFAAERLSCPVLAIGGWSDRYANSVMPLVAARPDLCWGVVGPWSPPLPRCRPSRTCDRVSGTGAGVVGPLAQGRCAGGAGLAAAPALAADLRPASGCARPAQRRLDRLRSGGDAGQPVPSGRRHPHRDGTGRRRAARGSAGPPPRRGGGRHRVFRPVRWPAARPARRRRAGALLRQRAAGRRSRHHRRASGPGRARPQGHARADRAASLRRRPGRHLGADLPDRGRARPRRDAGPARPERRGAADDPVPDHRLPHPGRPPAAPRSGGVLLAAGLAGAGGCGDCPAYRGCRAGVAEPSCGGASGDGLPGRHRAAARARLGARSDGGPHAASGHGSPPDIWCRAGSRRSPACASGQPAPCSGRAPARCSAACPPIRSPARRPAATTTASSAPTAPRRSRARRPSRRHRTASGSPAASRHTGTASRSPAATKTLLCPAQYPVRCPARHDGCRRRPTDAGQPHLTCAPQRGHMIDVPQAGD